MRHTVTAEGESMEKWALLRPGFAGSIAQLTSCARCGEPLPPKRPDEPRHFRLSPTIHVLCDDCHDDLPD